MTRIVVPPHAGVLSAVGLALAPERRESLVSVMQRADTMSRDALAQLLEAQAAALRGDPKDGADVQPRWWMRARYEGQGYELDVPVRPGDTAADLVERFVARHQQRAGFVLNRPVECISARTTLSSAPWPVHFRRPVCAGELSHDVDDGRAMSRVLQGHAVVRLPDATMHVANGWSARTLDIGGWMLERQA
jgi:N-methylhydantoinase A